MKIKISNKIMASFTVTAATAFVVLHQPKRSTGCSSGEFGHENCYTSMNCHCWVASTQYFITHYEQLHLQS